MEINLKGMKLSAGQGQLFHSEIPGNNEILKPLGKEFGKPIFIDIRLEIEDQRIKAFGTISTEVVLNCSRCLEPFVYDINANFAVGMIDISLQEEQDLWQDELVFIKDGIADFSALIYDIILTQVPMAPLCSINCKGLCPICGIDLNSSSCQCQQDNIDPRWEKLRHLT
ncbi:MAG: DUF177 domain-containing protein [Syntrophomonadaceae bacterium]|nr:DUF177 domain-containing protein [Syntrophomonadaceae bacterium]